MKRTILSMAVFLALGTPVPVSAQRHRHTPRTETVAQKPSDDRISNAKASAKADKGENSNDEGIEAYSDTSSVVQDDNAAYNVNDEEPVNDSNRYDPGRFKDPVSWLAFLCSTSFVGTLVAVLILVIFLACLFMPLIIVLLVIRYFIRRHNDRVRLAEKAMEEGRSMTDEEMPLSKKSPDYMWRRGVRNVSIGLGLMIFFWFIEAKPLVGIGGLVACLGAGQMFMVRYNYDCKFGRKKKDGAQFDSFDDSNVDISDMKFVDDEKKDK